MDSLGALHFPKLVGLVLLLRHSQLRNDYLVRFLAEVFPLTSASQGSRSSISFSSGGTKL